MNVVIKPVSIPMPLEQYMTTGARQLVVHEALKRCYELRISAFINTHYDNLAFLEQMITSLPASRWPLAFQNREKTVDSIA